MTVSREAKMTKSREVMIRVLNNRVEYMVDNWDWR